MTMSKPAYWRLGAGAGERTGDKEELVLWGKGLDGRVDLVVEILGAQAEAADVLLGRLAIQVLDRGAEVGEIDTQYFASPTEHGHAPPR
jgi:hypothetical protein